MGDKIFRNEKKNATLIFKNRKIVLECISNRGTDKKQEIWRAHVRKNVKFNHDGWIIFESWNENKIGRWDLPFLSENNNQLLEIIEFFLKWKFQKNQEETIEVEEKKPVEKPKEKIVKKTTTDKEKNDWKDLDK